MAILMIGLLIFLFFGFMALMTGGDQFVVKMAFIGFVIMIVGIPFTLIGMMG